MTQGYIYALINPSLHGLVKVGKTVKEPEIRAKEISSDTGVPTPFIVAYKVFVSDCDSAELHLHSLLQIKGFRINQNREFFNAPLDEIIGSMIELQNSSNFRLSSSDSKITNDNVIEYSELVFEDDFLNELEIEQTPVYMDVLNNAEDFYYGLDETLQDYSEALKLYKHVVRLGGVEAYSRIGQMYTDGEGCRIDYPVALNYLKEGVSKGNENCYFYMGILFSNTENFANMNKCFRKYFLSSTFNEDKQNKVLLTDRMGKILVYLSVIFGKDIDIDPDVLINFFRLNKEIEEAFTKKISYLMENPQYENLTILYKKNRKHLFELFNKIENNIT